MSDEVLFIIGTLIGLGIGAIFLHFYYRNR
jgi:hypothetical protein